MMRKFVSLCAALIAHLRCSYAGYLLQGRVIYRLVDVNVDEQQIMLQVKGKSIVFKQNFTQLATSLDIINGLSAFHASLVGVFYGRVLAIVSHQGSVVRKNNHTICPFKQEEKVRYRILYESRGGELCYLDTITQKQFVELPAAIMQSEYVIKKFTPNQACYIGMLAGMTLEKKFSREKKQCQKHRAMTSGAQTHLRAVD